MKPIACGGLIAGGLIISGLITTVDTSFYTKLFTERLN